MGFGKAFGLGLLTYILLNLGLFIVFLAIYPGGALLIVPMLTNIWDILIMLFAPAAIIGGTGIIAIGTLFASTNLVVSLFQIILLVLPGLLAALVAGKSAESAGAGFGGWFLAAVICAVIVAVLAALMPLTFGVELVAVGILFGISYEITLLGIILAGVTNGLIWSGVAAASAGP